MSRNCPYCKEEMEQGYIQCRDGLWWAKKKRPVPALPSMNKESVKLGTGGFLEGDTVEAYRCRACKKILIDYSDHE